MDASDCRGRHGAVLSCLASNGLLFVVLLCMSPTAGVIYLFSITGLVAACFCISHVCEMRDAAPDWAAPGHGGVPPCVVDIAPDKERHVQEQHADAEDCASKRPTSDRC